MLLVSAKVSPFKSIGTVQEVQIEPDVTALVGMNEAGKTVFLQALEKANDVRGFAKFEPVEDYPRRNLPAYLKLHEANPAEVVTLTYRPTADEIRDVNTVLSTKIKANFEFSVTHKYNNAKTISLQVDEGPVIDALLSEESLSSDASAALKKAKFVRDIPNLLKAVTLTDPDKAFLARVEARISRIKWDSIVAFEAWQLFSAKIPKFLYFSDYDLLPSKINLADLAQRSEQSKNDRTRLSSEHHAVLALLRMADISIGEFTKTGGYESLKAKVEGVSISLTDQIMEFWKQNENLEVEVDIRPDPEDEAPYNNGPNLYLRIKNLRHRGVSTPFKQRSRGFIWFFSFLVWFDSVQHQVGGDPSENQLILLLDEPGLALHALAQADFLRYIERLSKKHQVLYTTHSPFMIDADPTMRQIRVVEDRDGTGSVISSDLGGSDPRTLFPLQAALGWNIAQNLFISKRNLLVEGPSELIYLKSVSAMLETQGRTGLRDDITIVPVGGLDKVATFVSLLGANGLEMVVLHDYRGVPEQKLKDAVKQKLIPQASITNVSRFRDLKGIGQDGRASDTEDLFDEVFYLERFTQTFEKALGKTKLKLADLPPGERIVERIGQHLEKLGIKTRPTPGFNHYAVAMQFAANPPAKLDDNTLLRFEEMFKAINARFAD